MAGLEPLMRVRFHGLSNEQLNGVVGVVLPPADRAEQRRLEESGRVKVSYFPKPLSLKPENLAPADEPDFASPPLPFTVLQVVGRDEAVVRLIGEAAESGEDLGHLGRIGDADSPSEFAESLWRLYDRGGAAAPKLPADFDRIVLDTPGHHLYRISLQQIAHEVVIEACDGVFRGFQAMKKLEASEPQDFREFGGVLVQTADDHEARGFSGREWVSSEQVGSAREFGAYKLWGGGKNLSRKDAGEVLRLIANLQRKVQDVVGKLREQAPVGVTVSGQERDEAAAAWAEEMLEKARLTLTPSRPGTPRSGESNEVWVFVSDVKPEHDFQLPPEMAKGFMRDYARLTGEFPQPQVFLHMLVFLGWETAVTQEGGGMGWTMRHVDLRNR